MEIDDGEDGPPGPDELDLQRGFSRPKIVNEDEPELSDYVLARLAVIRVRALHKYRESML